MAKGLKSIVEVAGADLEKRKTQAAEGDFQKKLFFKVNPGESVLVRFLEQGDDVNWAYVHGDFNERKIVCLDQDEEGRRTGEPCPGCESGSKRSIRGAINLIWRDAEGSGEDKVAIWTSGPRVFIDTLADLDATYRGLSSRDFRVTRKGVEKDTTYSIQPADPDGGPQKMSKADEALFGEKYDLSWYVEPPKYEEYYGSPTTEKRPEPVRERSPFARTRS